MIKKADWKAHQNWPSHIARNYCVFDIQECWFLLFDPLILSLAESITKDMKLWPHYYCILDKFLHTINESISVTARNKPTSTITSILLCELCICHRNWTLTWNMNMRIRRLRMRSEFTVLNDWEPPRTCAIANVRPWVGRTEPIDKGIQSIWFLKTAV